MIFNGLWLPLDLTSFWLVTISTPTIFYSLEIIKGKALGTRVGYMDSEKKGYADKKRIWFVGLSALCVNSSYGKSDPRPFSYSSEWCFSICSLKSEVLMLPHPLRSVVSAIRPLNCPLLKAAKIIYVIYLCSNHLYVNFAFNNYMYNKVKNYIILLTERKSILGFGV